MPRLTITSGSAGAIFISFRGWLQQLALVREREKKEERNLACVWAPLGLHARRGGTREQNARGGCVRAHLQARGNPRPGRGLTKPK